MFVGSIPAEIRSIVSEYLKLWKPQELWVAGSGNFTIERIANSVDPAMAIHGNDVSIYTCTLGDWLAGQPVQLAVKDASLDRLDWLAEYFDGGIGSVAALMIAGRFMEFVDKADHPYFGRMLTGWRAQFPKLFDETRAKLEKLTLRLKSFAAEDMATWLPNTVPADGAVMTFPPFYKGGYSTLYKDLDLHLDWPEPAFDEMDRGDVLDLLEVITGRERWMVALPEPDDELHQHLRGIVQTSAQNIPIYVYTSGRPMRISRPRQQLEPVYAPRLRAGETIEGPLTLAPLTPGQFGALRSQYLDRKIVPSANAAAVAYAVCCAGKIVGVFAFRPQVKMFDTDGVYLMADFAVPHTDYRRLSKLVLAAAMSHEARQLIEGTMNRRVTHVETTAFTDRPVSMKYRGLMTKGKTGEDKSGAHKHAIAYSAPAGRWNLQEAYEMWTKKWGQ